MVRVGFAKGLIVVVFRQTECKVTWVGDKLDRHNQAVSGSHDFTYTLEGRSAETSWRRQLWSRDMLLPRSPSPKTKEAVGGPPHEDCMVCTYLTAAACGKSGHTPAGEPAEFSDATSGSRVDDMKDSVGRLGRLRGVGTVRIFFLPHSGAAVLFGAGAGPNTPRTNRTCCGCLGLSKRI